eukprot:scaffold180793_cov32-Tisochrysis_lutea.AAC.2
MSSRHHADRCVFAWQADRWAWTARLRMCVQGEPFAPLCRERHRQCAVGLLGFHGALPIVASAPGSTGTALLLVRCCSCTPKKKWIRRDEDIRSSARAAEALSWLLPRLARTPRSRAASIRTFGSSGRRLGG